MKKPQTTAQPEPQAYWNIPPETLLANLHSSDHGLQQADAVGRIKQYGLNVLQVRKQVTALGLLINQFKSPLVLILIFAAAISAFVGEWTDAIIVLAVVIGSTMLGFVQEYSASSAVEKLRSQVTIKSNVLRNGQAQMIPSEQVVPGDVVVLSAGSSGPRRWGAADSQRFLRQSGSADRRDLSH